MENSPFSLEGKNILITGASSGIGRSCSVECARMGANLLLFGRNMDRLEDTLREINKVNAGLKRLTFIKSADLNVEIEEIGPAIEEFVSNHGRFDGFVHSAGIEKTMPLSGMKNSDYDELFNINVIAGLQLTRLISKRKNSNDNSSFVFISSITGLIGRKGIVGYSASKGALIAGIRSLALELAGRGMRANCISPGTVLTPLMVKYLESLTPEERIKRLDGYPLKLGDPQDIAYGTVYLLSRASRWITGQNLVIDGGFTAS
jgi:NAD(P)-dependent dehydrogenase (short-subunit alcohol dehydrogenase family)